MITRKWPYAPRLLTWAEHLIARGIPCFPQILVQEHTGRFKKIPALPEGDRKDGDGGHKNATTDREVLHYLWSQLRRRPDVLGVPVGEPEVMTDGRITETMRCSILDIDMYGGDWLQRNKRGLPETLVHRSISGGLHFYFLHEPSVGTSASKIAEGVDIKSSGAITWWPSYGLPILKDAPIARMPAWLIELAHRAAINRTMAIGSILNDYSIKSRDYGIAVLENEVFKVMISVEGSRNVALNKAAYAIFRYCFNGPIGPEEAAYSLLDAARTAGIDEREAEKTIQSAWNKRLKEALQEMGQ